MQRNIESGEYYNLNMCAWNYERESRKRREQKRICGNTRMKFTMNGKRR